VILVVDLDDTQGAGITFLKDFFGMFDAFFADLGDMDQTILVVVDLDERSVGFDVGYASFDDIANFHEITSQKT
jgi:hypothetical protein